MDRSAIAYQYHKEGWNCAQSVAGACASLAGRTPEEVMPLLGGFGGGIGGSHETSAAQRLGISAHCDVMIVTAVELVEALVQEEREQA